MQESQHKRTYFCWICSHALDLETCKTDEHGMAVHENCYVLKIGLANESTRLMAKKTAHAIAALRPPPSGP